MKVMRTLVAAVVSGCGLVLLGPAPPASACSCVAGNPATYVEWAEVIFVGTLTGPPSELGQGPPLLDSTDPVAYTFDVEKTLEGEASDPATVQSARSSASCGLEGMQVGTSYVMFADATRGPDDALSATLCGGSQPATPRLVQRVEALTGGAETPAPSPAADPSADPADPTEAAAPTGSEPGDSSGMPPAGYVLAGLAVVALAATAWALVRWRGPSVGVRA